MVSSGTGQNPTRPSQGVLYLLQRSGLMSNQQYDFRQCCSILVFLIVVLQRFTTPNHVRRISIFASSPTRTVVGSITTIPAHGRGKMCYTPRYPPRADCSTGKANGPRRGPYFFFHAVHYGARACKSWAFLFLHGLTPMCLGISYRKSQSDSKGNVR